MNVARSITAADLAHRVEGVLVGDGQRVITDVGTLDEAGPSSVSWLADKKYVPQLEKTRAGVVLVPAELEMPASCTLIRVKDPDLALCAVLESLSPPMETIPPGIDPLARVAESARVEGACIGPFVYVGPDTEIGPGTQLHPHTYVGANCRIGRDCLLYPGAVVREYCTLGDRVILHGNSTIGTDGFGYHQVDGRHVKIPQIGTVEIGDDVEIGANTCVDRARSGVTRIGRGTKIDNLVQIGHNNAIGEDCIIISQTGISGSCKLGRHVMLAGQVGVADHADLGDRVVVAAKSGVPANLEAGKVYRGIPCSEVGDFGRQAVALRRLPKALETLRTLKKRVDQLESTTDDTKRS